MNRVKVVLSENANVFIHRIFIISTIRAWFRQ